MSKEELDQLEEYDYTGELTKTIGEIRRLHSIIDELKATMHAHTAITSVLTIVDNAHYKAFHND